MKSIKEIRNEINESKQEDIADLKALLKNPDPKVAKNYGGIEGYKKMIQSKIDRLMKEEVEELEEGIEVGDTVKIKSFSAKTNRDSYVDVKIVDITKQIGGKLFVHYNQGGKVKKMDYKIFKQKMMKEELEEEPELDEAMTRAQRIKRSKIMKRLQPKIKRAKERAAKKKASFDMIDKRAEKQAKEILIKKWLKGKSKGDVPFAERERIEDKLKKSKKAVDRIKKKLFKVIRKQEAEKFTKKESTELD